MELYDHVYQIQSLYGGRNLFQYLLAGDNVVLVDTGIAETPQTVVFPFMDKLGLPPEKLTLAVTTHADLDHQGGNDSIKRQSPQTLLTCGEADRELVESRRKLYDERYNFLRENHAVGFDRDSAMEAGRQRKLDATFAGGERIRLGDEWDLEVLHVPGHSHGHLALYDAKHKAAFVGDAIHGRGCPKAEGGMAIPVTHYYVDLYLRTLRYFESLDIKFLYSGHGPIMRGEEVRDFISESRQTVELLDRAILASLTKQRPGLTLKELIDVVSNAVGDWPPDSWPVAMFAVIRSHGSDGTVEQSSTHPGYSPCPVGNCLSRELVGTTWVHRSVVFAALLSCASPVPHRCKFRSDQNFCGCWGVTRATGMKCFKVVVGRLWESRRSWVSAGRLWVYST